ncbi:MAG: arylamine N-acetyltransferase [Pseudomonadales bacterium]
MTKAAQESVLAPDQVETLLERFGLSGYPSADLPGLTTLYDAWCRHVPFDNARKLIAVRAADPAPLPGDSPPEFLDAWLQHGVGGTCWAGNGALCELLRAIGFTAQRGVGTMMVAPDIPPNHGTVVVELPEGAFVVDASIMHVTPLAIREGQSVSIDQPAWGVTGHWLGERYAIRWQGLANPEPFDCRIDEWPVDRQRFATQHEMTRTWSPFNFELMFNLVRGDGRIGIAQNQAAKRDAQGRLTLTALERTAGGGRLGYLVDELGISEALAARIPDDVATPPPPGSRTAARAGDGA